MKLIITKTLGDSVPDELQDEVFNFHINAYVGKVTVDGTDIEVKEQPFANIPYELYQKKYISASEYDALSPEEQGNYILEETEYYCWESIENTIPHTTDANGSLHLKDKQKAEFTYISLVDYASFHITTEELAKREIDAYNIEEEVKPYWYATKEVKTQTGQTSPEGFSYSECSVEFRNDFRPVITGKHEEC